MKVVFFGTSDVGLPVLDALRTNHEVVLVVSSPDAPVGRKQILTPSPIAEYAVAHNLKIVKPQKVRNNPEFLDLLRAEKADIFIVVSYGKILPQELLDIPRLKTLNVHFSLLPKYRGAAPIQFALLNGETKTGTTIFVLDAEVDHGPMLAQAEFKIDPDDTFLTLASELSAISAEMLMKILPEYEAGKLEPRKQEHDQASFTKIIKKEDGKIDWSKSAIEIYNMWRAYNIWPGIFSSWEIDGNKKQIKIIECILLDPEQAPKLEILAKPPGTITVEGELVFVTCGKNSILLLLQVQLEGKNPTNMPDFLRGYPKFNGSKLE